MVSKRRTCPPFPCFVLPSSLTYCKSSFLLNIGRDWREAKKGAGRLSGENGNLKYDDLVSCIEFLSIRGVEIDDVKLHDQFCNLISFLKSKSDEDEAYYDLKLHEQLTVYFLRTAQDLRVLFLYKRT